MRMNGYRQWQKVIEAQRMAEWEQSLRDQAKALTTERLEELLKVVREKMKNSSRTSENVFGAIQLVAEQVKFLKYEEAIQNELIQRKTGLDPTAYWRMFRIKSQGENFHLIKRRGGKMQYQCENCFQIIGKEAYQLLNKHIYVCPSCMKKIHASDSPANQIF